MTLRNPCSSPKYSVVDPDICDDEMLPSCWQTYAERKGVPEPEIWPLWRAFKDRSRYPFEQRRWKAWIDACVRNRQRRKEEAKG